MERFFEMRVSPPFMGNLLYLKGERRHHWLTEANLLKDKLYLWWTQKQYINRLSRGRLLTLFKHTHTLLVSWEKIGTVQVKKKKKKKYAVNTLNVDKIQTVFISFSSVTFWLQLTAIALTHNQKGGPVKIMSLAANCLFEWSLPYNTGSQWSAANRMFLWVCQKRMWNKRWSARRGERQAAGWEQLRGLALTQRVGALPFCCITSSSGGKQ